MKRWLVITTVLATVAGVGGLGTAAAVAATPAVHQAARAGHHCGLLCHCRDDCDHGGGDGDGGDGDGGGGGGGGDAGISTSPHDPISINGDPAFTTANGVTNPAGCGTSDIPCQINGWGIAPKSGGTCIVIQNTTKVYVVHDNSCTGGTNGIVVRRAPGGTVRDNTVSRLLGVILTGTDATGILVDTSNDVTVTGNRLSTITGSSGAGIGQKGGSAFGIHVLGGHRVDIEQNTINPVTGGTGFPALGIGQSGANGGNALGIVAENMTATTTMLGGLVGPPLSTLLGPVVDLLAPALPGPLAAVAATPLNLNVAGNTISALNGGGGGAGSFFGTPGGNGGSAEGVLLTAVAGSAVTGNTISSLRGANGGNGSGARGGNGGNAFGIHRVNSTVTPQLNQITLLAAGTGGSGFPAGQNGTARDIV